MSKKKIPQRQTNADLLNDIAKDIEKAAKLGGIHPTYMKVSDYYNNGGLYNDWQLRKVGGFNHIKRTFFEPQEEKNRALITDVKEIRKQQLALEKQLGNNELFLQRVEESVTNMPEIKLAPYTFKKKRSAKPEPRTVNLALSDLHFGSDLVKEEVGVDWGPVEEARSFAKVVKNVSTYKMQYRDQTKLSVLMLGDIIENELHGRTSADLLHRQTCRAIHLLTQGVARFSENFPEVEVHFAVGNHGRDISQHKERAVHLKYNALETTIYYAIKTACRGLKNVTFNQPLTPYIQFMSQGHKMYATHGDTHLNPGNPGNKIDTRSLETQINKINASLKDRQEFKAFIVGHVHQATVTQLPNGAHLIVNGALTPPNSFATSLNIMESRQSQVMWESTPEYAVGDFRIIDVTDIKNKPEHDVLIQPFRGIQY